MYILQFCMCDAKLKIFDSIWLSRRLRWAAHVARIEEGRSTFKMLTDKLIGKIILDRPRQYSNAS